MSNIDNTNDLNMITLQQDNIKKPSKIDYTKENFLNNLRKKNKDYFKCVERMQGTRQVYHTTPSCKGLGFLNVINLKLKPKDYEFYKRSKPSHQGPKDTDL